MNKILKAVYNDIVSFNLDDQNGWIKESARNSLWRYEFDLEVISCLFKKKCRVLDCGAAPFVLPLVLFREGFLVKCVDVNPDRYSNVNKLPIKIEKCDIERDRLPYEDNAFELVLFNEIFEHLRKDIPKTMREISRVLKKEGVLMLSTPNLYSIKGIVNFLFKRKAYSCAHSLSHEWLKIEKIGHMGHIREYTAKEVCIFLEDFGFTCEKIFYRGRLNRGKSKFIYNFLGRIIPSWRPNMLIIFKKKD